MYLFSDLRGFKVQHPASLSVAEPCIPVCNPQLSASAKLTKQKPDEAEALQGYR
jgi:hypothetical protein